MLKIGAATHLADNAADSNIQKKYTALAQRFQGGSPHIRDMGTIGGNIAAASSLLVFQKSKNRLTAKGRAGTHALP
jgi:xanthine dehydrogenase YagS FAD-binding subunit